MIEKIIQDLETAENAYRANATQAREDQHTHMHDFWDGCANGVGRALEIVRHHMKEGTP